MVLNDVMFMSYVLDTIAPISYSVKFRPRFNHATMPMPSLRTVVGGTDGTTNASAPLR